MGKKLGNLDVLASSTTFASAMLAQLSLRSVSAIGCLLATVWALSPVRGQASLRIMAVGKMPVTNTASFDYLSMNNSYSDWHSASGGGGYEHTATGLYLASLIASQRIKDSPADQWDNVKIPMLEDIPGWTENASATDSWYDVPQGNVSYSSLVGVPVSGIDFDSEAAFFKLETSYWRLECPIVQRGSICALLEAESFLTNDLTPNYTVEPEFALNTINRSDCIHADWYGMSKTSSSLYTNSSGFGGTGRDCTSNQTHTPARHLIYSGWSSYDTADVSDLQFSAYCVITTSYVEAEVRCKGRACTVPRVRRSHFRILHLAGLRWTMLNVLTTSSSPAGFLGLPMRIGVQLDLSRKAILYTLATQALQSIHS